VAVQVEELLDREDVRQLELIDGKVVK